MIDLHFHLLASVDDGPSTNAEAVALARAAVAAGTETVVATPHVDHRYCRDLGIIPHGLAALRELLEREGVPLQVRQGAEVAASRLLEATPAETERMTLGAGRFVLLESPHGSAGAPFANAIFQAQARGLRVVLAHPERCPTFIREPLRVAELVERDVVVQVTAGSFSGRFGTTVQRAAFDLVRRGLVHVVASDAHDARRRPPGCASGLDALADCVAGADAHRDLWTREAPAAVLRGEQPPAPPRFTKRRRLTPWRREPAGAS